MFPPFKAEKTLFSDPRGDVQARFTSVDQPAGGLVALDRRGGTLLKVTGFCFNKVGRYSSGFNEGLMRRIEVGQYAVSIAGSESVRAFVPASLPPKPPLHLEGTVRDALDRALLALGRLDGAAATLPDVQLLLYTYQRKEAVLSSQIEGTQSTLDDLLAHEPTVTQALRELEKLGIVRETTGRARGRVFAYARYLDALNAENESAA